MKILLLLATCVMLSGCASLPKYVDQVKQARDAINNLLPSDFKGDVDIERHDSYVDITLKGGNVHKNAGGEWTWNWIDLEENSHFPIAGVAWVGRTSIKLGNP